MPAKAAGQRIRLTLVPDSAPAFVRNVIATILELRGDTLPVSALPMDGTYPDRNDAIREAEHRGRSADLGIRPLHPVRPVRDRLSAQRDSCQVLRREPSGGRAGHLQGRADQCARLSRFAFTLQVYVEDCTGCGVCVENCPAHSPADAAVKAINMKHRLQHLEAGRESVEFFEKLPWADRTRVNFANVRGVQFLEPLFEFSGACAGCGETPYLKLMSQLFGDRLQIANATGCSSIYGGNLPTTPWAREADGRGPAWRLALRGQRRIRPRLSDGDRQPQRRRRGTWLRGSRRGLAGTGDGLPLQALQVTESDFRVQRQRVAALKTALARSG